MVSLPQKATKMQRFCECKSRRTEPIPRSSGIQFGSVVCSDCIEFINLKDARMSVIVNSCSAVSENYWSQTMGSRGIPAKRIFERS